MKVLLAFDSFKSCLSSDEISIRIASIWRKTDPAVSFDIQLLGDGGEGSLLALENCIDVEKNSFIVRDPIGRNCTANYLNSGTRFYLEMAQTSGLELVEESERDILNSSSYGIGQMIKFSILKGAKEIYILIGGSATHDFGFGMAEALGYHFYQDEKKVISITPDSILRINRVEEKAAREFLKDIKFHILCDVTNPLTGANGSAFTYARQKGATNSEQVYLENCGLYVKKLLNMDDQFEGAGAAGGMGYGAKYFLEAQIQSGIEFMIAKAGLEQRIMEADLVITGEGKIDDQSLHGKLISGVAKRAAKHKKPCLAVCAVNQLKKQHANALNLTKIYSLFNRTQKKIDIAETILRLDATTVQMANTWKTV